MQNSGSLHTMMARHRPLRSVNRLGMALMNHYENAHAKFSLFGHLPLELRRSIWRKALQIPSIYGRVIKVSIHSVKIERDYKECRCVCTECTGIKVEEEEENIMGEQWIAPCGCNGDYHICDIIGANFEFNLSVAHEETGSICDLIRADIGVLSACQESRREYLHTFPFALPSVNAGLIHFNSNDIILIDNPDMEQFPSEALSILKEKDMLPDWLSQVGRLAMPEGFYYHDWTLQQGFISYIPYLPNLQEIFVTQYIDEPIRSPLFNDLAFSEWQNGIWTQGLVALRSHQFEMEMAKQKYQGDDEVKWPEVKLIQGMEGAQFRRLITEGCRMQIFDIQALYERVSICLDGVV